MPNKSFYRDYVAFYKMYGYYDNYGNYVSGYTEPFITKVNIQPFKEGEMLTFTESTTYYQKGYKKVYTREFPTFTEETPEDSEFLFYHAKDGEFYQVQGNMDYQTPARGPKHFKFLAVKYPDADTPDITPPTFPE